MPRQPEPSAVDRYARLGIAPDAVPGVGLASMSERAAEVGGVVSVASSDLGTTVTARLPLELM